VFTVNRARIGRWATRLAVTSLVALQLSVGTAGAADTREIYLGSGPVNEATNGQLTLTPVTVGGVTATNVIVKNIDNQTLTHVVVTLQAPTGGLTFADAIGGDSDECAATESSPLVCDFGNLARNQTRTFTALFNAVSGDASQVSFSVTFNESNTPSGANSHVEPATATITPQAGGCDLVATFLPPGQVAKLVGTGCAVSSSNPQTTAVLVPGSIQSTIRVAEETSGLCPAGLECFGQDSIADLGTDGTYTVIWTIQWQVASNFNINRFGILHFPDGSTTPDLTLTYKKNICKTATATGCIESLTLDGTTLSGVFRTRGNGVMKGFS
jgi:hypothetical protein